MTNSVGQAFKDPAFLADASVNYTADEFRVIFDLLTSPGRRDDSSLRVTQHAGTANMSVDVSVGGAVVGSGTTDTGGLFANGLYGARLMAPISGLAISTAPGTGSRIDRVYLAIADKTVVGSGNNEFIIGVQAGQAGTTPAVPALPAASIELAQILIPANASTITNAMITRTAQYSIPSSVQPAINTSTFQYSPVTNLWNNSGSYGPWYIPDGSWNVCPGSQTTISALAGNTYLIATQFSLGIKSTATAHIDVRTSLAVNGTEIAETYTMLQAGDGTRPAQLSKWWTCTASGRYTIATRCAASTPNLAFMQNPYYSPYTDVVDLGLLNQ